jgi:hypothetical protein
MFDTLVNQSSIDPFLGEVTDLGKSPAWIFRTEFYVEVRDDGGLYST